MPGASPVEAARIAIESARGTHSDAPATVFGAGFTTSAELATTILEEAEVAVVPGEAFGTPGYLRLSYALGDDDLVEGISRIAKLVGDSS